MRFDVTPWLGTRVSVTSNNAYKGYRGTIKDVLCTQKTTNALRFQVELDSNPVVVEFFDYKNLLEASYVYYWIVLL